MGISKLAILLPCVLEMALAHGYYYNLYAQHQTIPVSEIHTNRWGENDAVGMDGTMRIGSFGGGYYGGTMGGLRDSEKGKAGNREFGYYSKEYPYKYEKENTLFNESLIALSPEARLRFFKESFREHVYNITGQLPTYKEVGKMRNEFIKYVKKEMSLTDEETRALFGRRTKSKTDGILPGYLLFDDMDEHDFDPVEALKYMPRIRKDATKEELDDAYLKVWKMLGKSNERLQQIYNAYKEKYLRRNPLGPVMTEKEFLLFSLRLREKEALRLGYFPIYKDMSPFLKNLDIAYFLRNKLGKEFEDYRKNGSKNIHEEAIFTDKIIIQNPNEPPSPYDPIKGRLGFEGRASPSELVNATQALLNIKVENMNGDLLSDTGIIKHHTSQNGPNNGPPDRQQLDDPNGIYLKRRMLAEALWRLPVLTKRKFPKTPSQILFENSPYSTSAQKRVIDSLDDYVLVNLKDMTLTQIFRMFELLRTSDTDSNIKAQIDYFKQRIGEQGRDYGTNIDIYSNFSNDKFKTTYFFIPKTVVEHGKFDRYNLVLPVPATGFNIKDLGPGRANIHNEATGLSFDVDYSGRNSLYLNNYLSTDPDQSNPIDLSDIVNFQRQLPDSILPAPERYVSVIDSQMKNLENINTDIKSLIEYSYGNVNQLDSDAFVDKIIEENREAINSGRITEDEIKRSLKSLREMMELKSQQIREYRDARNLFVDTERTLYDTLEKMKETLRTKLVAEELGEMINSHANLKYLPERGTYVSENFKYMNNVDLAKLSEKKNMLEKLVEDEYSFYLEELVKLSTKASRCLKELENRSTEFTDYSGLPNALNKINSGVLSKIKESSNKLNISGTEVGKGLNKLEQLYKLQNSAVELLKKMDRSGKVSDGIQMDENAIKEVNEEINDIIKGTRDAYSYGRLISNKKNMGGLKYVFEAPDMPKNIPYPESLKELPELKEGEKTVAKPKSSSSGDTLMYSDLSTQKSHSFESRLWIVYSESIQIVEELVRSLFVSIRSNSKRKEELLKMESYFLNQTRKHRASLSLLLGRTATFEDEIITDQTDDELKIRIILKIIEERTKLLYVSDVIDKLYYYPLYFHGEMDISLEESIKLRRLEEDGILAKNYQEYGPYFTYIPDMYVKESEGTIGIYGYNKVDYEYFKKDLFNRLNYIYHTGLKEALLGFEVIQIFGPTELKYLEELLQEASFYEMSLYSSKLTLLNIIRGFISDETSASRRKKLIAAYRKIKQWIKEAETFEESFTDSSERSDESSESKTTGTDSSHSGSDGIKPSTAQRCVRGRKNN